jgi:hypothetical protein
VKSTDAPSRARLAHYFARLSPALVGRQIEVDDFGVPQMPCRFLVVEDFGTTGLEGDTLLFRDPAPTDSSPQYFYWFWRNIGRSGKTGDELGRWGLGKTVFRAASRVGCMFGLTIRKSDQRTILMGQAKVIGARDKIQPVCRFRSTKRSNCRRFVTNGDYREERNPAYQSWRRLFVRNSRLSEFCKLWLYISLYK